MQQQLPKTLMAFFWHFIRPYKWFAITFIVTGLLWGIQTSLTPYLLKLIIDRVASHTGPKSTIFSEVWLLVAAYVGVWLIMAVNFRTVDWVKLKFFPSIRRDILNDMFAYCNLHSYSFLQNNFAGSLSNKIMDMSGSTASALARVDEAMGNIFAFLIALGMMYFVNPLFSLILFVWATLFMSVTWWFSKKTKKLSRDFSESKSTLSGKIVDSITNLISVRIFARHSFENNRLEEAVNDSVKKDRAVQFYIMKMRIGWDFTFIPLIALMLGSLVFLYSRDQITIGDFVFIMNVATNMFMHIWGIASQFVQFAEDLGKCSQALGIITAAHDVVDKEDAAILKVTRGEIVFDNVTFHYLDNKKLFQNKHIEIKASSKVGLVGFSGSGKTTFVNLIMRFFNLENGRILIDGQDIAGVTQESLREQIAMISQDPSLFHRSLMENIRYGNLDASDEEVTQASKNSHCHEFISHLPDGYESLVGERGIKLSGGQRQRIAIARAMLKNAPILILDEATSALDSVTEQLIQDSLWKLMQGKTTIVIAHRLSTLLHMDRILVFDQGKIVEDGTHAELLNKGGLYKTLWEAQIEGFLPDKREKTDE